MAPHPDVIAELQAEAAAHEAAKMARAALSERVTHIDEFNNRLSEIKASVAAAVPWKSLPPVILDAFKAYTERTIEPLREQIKHLQAEVAELKSREHLGVKYCGAWRLAEFGVGDLATYGGSLWHANRPTKAKPGTNDDWTLAVRKGRDADRGAGTQRMSQHGQADD